MKEVEERIVCNRELDSILLKYKRRQSKILKSYVRDMLEGIESEKQNWHGIEN